MRGDGESQLGHAVEAKKALDELIARWSDGAAYQIGAVYAWQGDTETAFQWMERAYRLHDGGLTTLRIDPVVTSLRGDARYVSLLRKMGLPTD